MDRVDCAGLEELGVQCSAGITDGPRGLEGHGGGRQKQLGKDLERSACIDASASTDSPIC